MNHQPFYHRATVLFTAVREVDESEVTAALSEIKGIVPHSLLVEEYDEPEPGDPSDLMS